MNSVKPYFVVFASILVLLFMTAGCGGASNQAAPPASQAEQAETAAPSNQAESQEDPDPTPTGESQPTATNPSVAVEDDEPAEAEEAQQQTSGDDLQTEPSETTALIVFSGSPPDEEDDIYVMDSLGDNLVNLTNSPEDDNSPTWSPDGTQIVWASAVAEDVLEVFVMNADGSGRQQLTELGGVVNTPVWSPDGSQILFRAVPASGEPDIYVMDANGDNLRQLTSTPANETSPDWSPDGSQIIFSSDQPGNDDIFVMDADGGNVRPITQTPTDEESPAWSPDGSQIVYVLDVDDNEDIYVMDADGSNPRRLTAHPASDDGPVWSPDGRVILFRSERNGSTQAFVVGTDGNDLHLLAGDETFEAGSMAVQPTAGLVAFGGEAVTETAVAATDDSETPAETSAPVSLDYSLADLLGDSDPNLYALPAPEGATASANSLEFSYGTSQSPADVIATYKQLLPALGWQEDSPGTENDDPGLAYNVQQGPNSMLVYAVETPAGTRVNLSVYYYADDELIDLTAVPVTADAVLLRFSQTVDFRYADAPSLNEQADAFRPPFGENLPDSGWELSFDEIRAGDGDLRYERTATDGTKDQVYVYFTGDGRVSVRGDFNSLAQEDNAAYVALEPTATPATVAGETWPSNTIPAINPADYSGEIVASGSSTVFTLAEAVAERFSGDGFTGDVTINNVGSTLTPLCGGQADIANYVAQIITQSERDECAPDGVEMVDFVVGRDVMVMAINPANDFAAEMTQAELALALTTAETWADVNPDWPDLPIQRFYPAIAYDLPASFLFTDPQLMENASNLTRSENDQALVDGVAQNEGAIGFFAYGVYQENRASVTAVRVDGYAPEDADYLFTLPLYMVTFDTIMQEKPQVAAYLGYVLVYGTEEALDVGFAPPDAETRQENEALWLEIAGE